MTKILVIEDEPGIRRNLVELLELEDFAVQSAVDGLNGVQLARDWLPDLIICDIMMPNLDGYGVLTELRRQPETTTTPFIFLTAKADKSDRRTGMGLGADDYLTKPFSSDEVLGAVNARLARKVTLTQQYEQRLTELRDNLALSMPHELRTPLTGIYTMSTVLLENFDLLDSADIRDGLQSIYSSAQRLERLVMNYLIYAELEIAMNDPARRQAARAQLTYSTKTLITHTAQNVAERAKRMADVAIDVANAPLAIAEEHFKKLIEELVDNACKFSAPGAPIAIGGQLDGARYRLTITDHGRGLKPEQIAAIGAYMQFERRLREQQGSGLGLAIARRLAQFYDGELSIQSTYDSGTTVVVTLPIAHNE
jgi:two-component system, sensor histidine kinase and response regulator